MTATVRSALRELALAQAHATCEAPEALDSALEHAQRAVIELQEVRRARHVAGVRAMRTEHIRDPLGRAIARLKGEG